MSRCVRVSSLIVVAMVVSGCKPVGQPTSANPGEAPTAVSADTLLKDYAANALAADTKYKGKRLQVTGKFGSIQKAPLYGYVLQLMPEKSEDLTLGIQCILGHEPPPEAANFKDGDPVKIQGTCDGQVVGQLKLSKCQIAK